MSSRIRVRAGVTSLSIGGGDQDRVKIGAIGLDIV
jgi:hypothetical protein